MTPALTAVGRERGFSLVEMMVSLLLLVIVMAAFLTLLDSSAQVSKTQTNIAGMTERLRVTVDELVRMVRMAGNGGLPLVGRGPGGALAALALDLENNVAEGAFVAGAPPRAAVPGTDVLTLRGVIGGDLFDLRGQVAFTDTSAGRGATFRLAVPRRSPFTGEPQALVEPPVGAAMILWSAWEVPLTLPSGLTCRHSRYNVALVTAAVLDGTGDLVVDLKTTGAAAAERALLELNEGGDFPPFRPEHVVAAGCLDDLTFFVADNDSLEPSLFLLSRADDTVSELVPGVCSLQVALACDLDGDGQVAEVGAAADDDEWFFNVAGDTPPTAADLATLAEVRLAVVARGDSREHGYADPLGPMPEDAPSLPDGERAYRHRTVSVRVAVRSRAPLVAPHGGVDGEVR